MEVNIVVASVAVVVSDRVVVAASVVNVGTVAEDVGGGCGSQNCCCISSCCGVRELWLMLQMMLTFVPQLRMWKRGCGKPKLLLHASVLFEVQVELWLMHQLLTMMLLEDVDTVVVVSEL